MLLGMNIRTLIFKPMTNLFNLYEFLNICYFCNDRYPGTLSKVNTLRLVYYISSLFFIHLKNLLHSENGCVVLNRTIRIEFLCH